MDLLELEKRQLWWKLFYRKSNVDQRFLPVLPLILLLTILLNDLFLTGNIILEEAKCPFVGVGLRVEMGIFWWGRNGSVGRVDMKLLVSIVF